MKDIRKQPYRFAPHLVPAELVGASYPCPECGSASPVPWTEKLLFPKQPLAHNEGGGYFVPASLPLLCGSCHAAFEIEIPRIKAQSVWTIYGDEAGRYIDQPPAKYSTEALHFFCITLVGLHNRRRERVRKQIQRLKKSIVPDRDPEDWQLHFRKIWGSDGRTDEFQLSNKDEKIAFAKKFARVLREARPELATMNFASCIVVPSDAKARAKQINFQKQDLFCLSLLSSLQQFRQRKLGLRWVFDNVKDTTGGERTEGWAKEAFLGLQYTRLFTWLSAGSTVLEPDFVQPGSHFLLEIADFVSYCVARDFDKNVQGAQSEFPSSLLGQGFFQGVLKDGSVEFQWSLGLPVEKFFGVSGDD